MNNRAFRIEQNGYTYLLRVASVTGANLDIDRSHEIAGARAVLWASDDGHILLDFIVGRHWNQDDFHNDERRACLARLLQRLHSARAIDADGAPTAALTVWPRPPLRWGWSPRRWPL